MTDTTTVQYHRDCFGPARPAINVKAHNAGLDYWPAGFDSMVEQTPGGRLAMVGPYGLDVFVHDAYERVTSDFWQTAEQIAMQRGLGEIAQEGRSGGWLVFTDTEWIDGVPVSDSAFVGRREWLEGYRAMSEWAREYIADAPRKVAALAQQYAMDAAGTDAARRMFAFR